MVRKSLVLKPFPYWFGLIMACFVYLVLRLSFPGTIEFGYDQPILALRVLSFLKNPSFVNAYNYVGNNPWGYPSWGPMQIFFYSPFLLLSKNPIVISNMIAVFNLLSVILVYMIGYFFITKEIGLLAALLLAVHPWWIVFSRMIYQPSPVPTIICLGIILTLSILKREKTKLIVLLPIIWAMAFQLYIHTFSFIIASLVVVFLRFGRINKRLFFLGIIVSLILFIPHFKYYSLNHHALFDFVGVEKKFEQMSPPRTGILRESVKEFISVISGGDFNWQLGYAYKDFLEKFVGLNILQKFSEILSVLVILYNILALFISKKKKLLRFLLLASCLGPVWFLVLIKSPIILPRYFLISLPSLSLLTAMFVNEIPTHFFKRTRVLLSIILRSFVLINILFWGIFIIRYFRFIENFNYPNGFLSNYSDVPFIFVENALNIVLNDGKTEVNNRIVISDESELPGSFTSNWAVKYTWENVFNRKIEEGDDKTINFLMDLSPIKERNNLVLLGQSGPYVIYRVVNSLPSQIY